MKRTLLVMLTSGSVLTGCSILSNEQTDAPSNAELQAQLNQQQQEWQAMKPQLQRILALESDLKLLVEALDTVPESSEEITQELTPAATQGSADSSVAIKPSAAMANMESTSSSDSHSASDAQKSSTSTQEDPGRAQFYQPQPSRSATSPATAAKTQTDDAYFGVQLAAYASKQQALQGWQTMSERYAQEFADIAPRIYQTTIQGKQYHKLIVGPFVEKPIAANFCNMLKQMQEECLVTRYQGEPFTAL